MTTTASISSTSSTLQLCSRMNSFSSHAYRMRSAAASASKGRLSATVIAFHSALSIFEIAPNVGRRDAAAVASSALEEKVAESKPGIVPETRTASLGGDFRFSFCFSSSSSSCGGGSCCCFRCCFSGASLFSRSCFRNVSRRCLEKKRNAEAHRFGRC